jgi:hypothetical protein
MIANWSIVKGRREQKFVWCDVISENERRGMREKPTAESNSLYK